MNPERIEEICSAPNLPGLLPTSVEDVEELMATHQNDPVLHFLLGNLFFKRGLVEQAKTSFLNVLELDSENAEARCNLGISYKALGQFDEAIIQLKQAILLKPSLKLAHLQIARIYLGRGEKETAQLAFERLLRYSEEHPEALTRLGEMKEQDGASAEAEEFYQKAYQSDPTYQPAICHLGRIGFMRGQNVFLESRYADAFQNWAATYEKYALAFTADQEVSNQMKKLVKDFSDKEGLEKALAQFSEALSNNEAGPQSYYALFSLFYFSLGAFPSFFEPFETLDEQIQRWEESLERDGEHPYPHFRLALIYTYQGRLEEAFSKLLLCQDKVLPKKQASLKLKETLDFVSSLRLKLKESELSSKGAESIDTWNEYGFSNRFERHAWEKSALTASEAKKWKDAGFSPEKARRWNKEKLEMEVALGFLKAGFEDPKDARRWHRGRFSPEDAKHWRTFFKHPVELAIQCKGAGLNDPKEANEWMKIFSLPWEASQWKVQGIRHEDAALFRENGVSDPFEASSILAQVERNKERRSEELEE